MSMKITQEFMDNEVVRPMMKQLDEIRKLIKSNDKDINRKMDLMSENIARMPKKRR